MVNCDCQEEGNAMVTKEQIEVEHLKNQEEIKRELKRTSASKEETAVVVEVKHKVWFGSYLLTLLGLTGLYYLFRLGFFDFVAPYVPLLQRLTIGTMAIVLVSGIAQAVSLYFIGRIEDHASQYNLRRILKLIVVLIIAV